MNKDLTRYKLIIVDMDGTLYQQKPVRIVMAVKLMLHILSKGASGIRDVKIISDFRKSRENDAFAMEEIIDKLSLKYKTTKEYTRNVIKKWMMEVPLALLPKYKNEKLCDELLKLKSQGIKVAVFSDYPAEDKCRVLGLSSIESFHADQPEIGEMKPSPKGILYIMDKYGIKDPKEVIMIGDRESRDGVSADKAGCDKYIKKGVK